MTEQEPRSAGSSTATGSRGLPGGTSAAESGTAPPPAAAWDPRAGSAHDNLIIKKRAAILSLVVGLLLLGVKIAAYLLTNSAAVLSDALESVVHIVGIAFAVYAIYLAAEPEDYSHPYGHGKVEFFSAGIEGSLIIIAAIAIMVDATRAIIFGRQVQALEAGLLLTLFSSLVTLALGLYLVSTGKRTRSLTLVADGKHILTDSITSFAVVIGLGLVHITGIELFDPMVAIGVAINIAVTGGRLVKTSVSGLMDEADLPLLEEIAAGLETSRLDCCIDLHRLRAWKAGEILHVDAHLTVPRYYTVEAAHDVMAQLERGLARTLDRRVHLLLHLDACTDAFCPQCDMKPCSIRSQPLDAHVPWKVSDVMVSSGERPPK